MHAAQGVELLPPSERAHLDALLARVLLAEPDEALREDLCAVRGALVELEPGMADWLEAPMTAERVEAAREEFARLFLLPGGVPPFASAWLAGERERLGAQVVAFVQAVLAALGRAPAHRPPWGNLPLDHLGLLLELAACSGASADPEQRAVGARLRAELLGAWVGSFGQALARTTTSPLYRAAGRLLAALHPCDELEPS